MDSRDGDGWHGGEVNEHHRDLLVEHLRPMTDHRTVHEGVGIGGPSLIRELFDPLIMVGPGILHGILLDLYFCEGIGGGSHASTDSLV